MTFANKALFMIIDLLNDNAIPYWLCNGTLLGVIRDSQLIPWDEDLDFGVSTEFSLKVRELINTLDFEILSDGAGSDYLLMKYTEGKNSIKIDINFYKQVENELRTMWRVQKIQRGINLMRIAMEKMRLKPEKFDFFWSLSGYTSLEKDVFPIKEIMFAGRKVSVPQNPESCLSYTYGKDWRIPKRDYNWRIDGANLAHSKHKVG